MARRDGIFPGESRLAGGDGKVKVYRMEFADGWGTMTAHAVMDGVTVIFNDFHTASGIQEEARCPGMVEINHCLAGRFECTMPDGRTAWLGPCDFAVSDMGRPPVESRFTQGLYQGISLVLDIRRASVSLQQMLGGEAPDLEALFEGLFESYSFLLLRSEPKIQHIFSELYHVPSEGQNAYYRLKTGELMLPFKEGSLKIAEKTGCPIVPIAVTNSAQIFENHFPKVTPCRVIVEYGQPIYPKDLSKEDKKFLGAYCQNIIAQMLRKNAPSADLPPSQTP